MAADEKTEKPTPKRRRDAREKGQVLKSQEVNTVFMLVVLFSVIKWVGTSMVKNMTDMMRYSFTSFSTVDAMATVQGIHGYFIKGITVFLSTMWPLFVAGFLTGIVVNIMQFGFLYTTKVLKPDFKKLNPLSGFKRMFSMKALMELFKSIAKITLIFYVVYSELEPHFKTIPTLLNYNVIEVMIFVFDVIMSVIYSVVIAFGVLALIDYFYQRHEHEKGLKMSKEEVKNEYKQAEGDPKVKGKIKQKQREVGLRRMMKAVPSADVVITNPTHYAVAIKYDESVNDAPVVVAKGKDFVALKIKEAARENRVEIVENKPLAQSLYAMCEINQQIPEEMFLAIAEILARVYKARRKF